MSRPAENSDPDRILPHPELNPMLNPLLSEHMGRWAEVYFTNPPEKREAAVMELLRELEGQAAAGSPERESWENPVPRNPPMAAEQLPENFPPTIPVESQSFPAETFPMEPASMEPVSMETFSTDGVPDETFRAEAASAEALEKETVPPTDFVPDTDFVSQTGEVTDASIHCGACGALSPATQRFCGMCGTPLSELMSAAVVEEPRESIDQYDRHSDRAKDTDRARDFESAKDFDRMKDFEPAATRVEPIAAAPPIPPRDRSADRLPDRLPDRSPEPSARFQPAPAEPNETVRILRQHNLTSLLAAESGPPRRYWPYVVLCAAILIVSAFIYVRWYAQQTPTAESSGDSPAVAPPENSSTREKLPPSPRHAATATRLPAIKKPLVQNESAAKGNANNGGASAGNSNAETGAANSTSQRSATSPDAKQEPDVREQPRVERSISELSESSHHAHPPAGQTLAGQALPAQDDGSQELAMARNYLDGTRGKEQNSSQAAEWLWKAVRKQNTTATLLLSDLYVQGNGVPKSCDQARVLLEAAARKGAAGADDRLRRLQSSGCQ